MEDHSRALAVDHTRELREAAGVVAIGSEPIGYPKGIGVEVNSLEAVCRALIGDRDTSATLLELSAESEGKVCRGAGMAAVRSRINHCPGEWVHEERCLCIRYEVTRSM